MYEHDVAEVDVGLPSGQRLLAHPVEADHRLQLGAVAVLQGGETQFALVAQEDDASGDAGHIAGLGAGFEVGVGGADLREAVGAVQFDRVRLSASARIRSRLPRRMRICSGGVVGALRRQRGCCGVRGLAHESKPYRAGECAPTRYVGGRGSR